MRTTILCFLISLLHTAGLYAQTNEQKAYQTYKSAREAYEAKQYQRTIDLLVETIDLLGGTKLRIQPMLINALIEIEDWHEASKQLDIYFRLNPDPQYVETQQMRTAEREVKAKVAADRQEFSAAKANPSQIAIKTYLNRWPHAIYRAEAEALLANQKDEDAWTIARDKQNTAAYYAYLDQYPNGKYATQARQTIDRWDQTAYEEAKATATQSAYSFYLDNYPRGKYRNEIGKLLDEKKDDDTYAAARESNTIQAYEGYVSRYPDGNHTWEARQIIQNSYFNWGEEAYKEKNYYTAKNHFTYLAQNYPSGKYEQETDKYLRKVERKLNMKSAGFIMYTYDSISNYGFSFGRLEPHKAGFYINLRGNPDIFTGLDVLYSIDEEGNNDSPWEDDIEYTGNRREANINLSAGMTFNLLYPIWGYVGAGAGYYPVYQEYDGYNRDFNNNKVYAGTEYFRIQSETGW